MQLVITYIRVCEGKLFLKFLYKKWISPVQVSHYDLNRYAFLYYFCLFCSLQQGNEGLRLYVPVPCNLYLPLQRSLVSGISGETGWVFLARSRETHDLTFPCKVLGRELGLFSVERCTVMRFMVWVIGYDSHSPSFRYHCQTWSSNCWLEKSKENWSKSR